MSVGTKPSIQWLHSLDEGLEKAKKTKQPVLLDFFNPGWGGCKKMGAVTYPDERVARMVTESFIPVQINVVDHPEFTDRFLAHWTPSFFILDPEGREHRRLWGYTYPEDFLGELGIMLAQEAFDNKRYEEAIGRYEKVVKDYPRSFVAPEALYMIGVSKYRATGDGSNLDKYWDQVAERYPNSRWAKAGEI